MIHLFAKPSPVFLTIFTLFSLASITFGQDQQTPKKIVFLGDSITAGYGLKKEEAYPALIKKLAMDDGHDVEIVNAGLSGDTTSGGLRRIRVLAKKPMDVLLIALGGNDGLRGIPPQASQKNLEAIVDSVRKNQPKVQIIIAGMQMPDNMGKEYTDAFRKIFSAVATQKEATLLPFLLEGVAAEKTLNLPDGIHPNTKGQVIVAAHVYKTIAPLVK